MRVVRGIEGLSVLRSCRTAVGVPTGLTVTVGSFDGVHLGHVHLLKVLRQRARMNGGESVVVTFADHPRRTVEPSVEMRELTSLREKELLIAEQGVDNLVVLPFDDAFRRMTADDFVRNFLVGRLGMRELVVGYNHRLGHDRGGDIDVLKRLGEKYNFSVHEASRFSVPGLEKISSTAIRDAILRGDLDIAEAMLGRAVSR